MLHHVCTVKTEPSFFFFILIVIQLTGYNVVVHLHTVYVEHSYVNFPCNSRMGSALCSHSCTVPKLFVTTALLSDCGPRVRGPRLGFVGPR